MTGILNGVQGGFMKFRCSVFLCDSRSKDEHYIKRDWEPEKTEAPGKDSVQHISLVIPIKTFLPPLHIKLELIKCLVKAMGKTNSKGFQYLSNKFLNISTEELEEGIFMGPQIHQILPGMFH